MHDFSKRISFLFLRVNFCINRDRPVLVVTATRPWLLSKRCWRRGGFDASRAGRYCSLLGDNEDHEEVPEMDNNVDLIFEA